MTATKGFVNIKDVSYDVKFQVEDVNATFEIEKITYKNGNVKLPNGKLAPVDEPTVGQEGLRAWLQLRIAGVNETFCQELSKANGAGFQDVIEESDYIVLKTGAKILSIDGKVTYHM